MLTVSALCRQEGQQKKQENVYIYTAECVTKQMHLKYSETKRSFGYKRNVLFRLASTSIKYKFLYLRTSKKVFFLKYKYEYEYFSPSTSILLVLCKKYFILLFLVDKIQKVQVQILPSEL